MGKFFINKTTFRVYFGKCFDKILLGDRPYSLKQETKIQEQPVLHTYTKTTFEMNPITKEETKKTNLVGCYVKEDVNVKTGKLTDEQKLLLKQQFLQLAYDSMSNNIPLTKIYQDLTYNPTNTLPIEAHYKSVQKSGNVIVERDYNEKVDEYWKKIEKTNNPAQTFKATQPQIELYDKKGDKLKNTSDAFITTPKTNTPSTIVPNYEYRKNTATTLLMTLKAVKNEVVTGTEITNVNDYFNTLYNAVLENMEEEDRQIIQNELPLFGITQNEKQLFLERNPELNDYFNSLDPVKGGNSYVKRVFPNCSNFHIPNSTKILEKYFPNSINSTSEKSAKDAYSKELPAFVDRILYGENLEKQDSLNIVNICYEFGINKNKINSEKDVDDFIQLVHDKLMPALVLSQKSNFTNNHSRQSNVVVSPNLNKIICSPETPKVLKYVVSKTSNKVVQKIEPKKTVYDTFIAPNIVNGSLNLKKMQSVWLDLSKKMDEPVKDTDSEALKIIKSHKDYYKDLTAFNGEVKKKGEEFNSFENKIEWRNQEVMNILLDSAEYFAPNDVNEQLKDSIRFGISPEDYIKAMHKDMRGREVASDSLKRLKSLNEKAVNNLNNPYRHCQKDEQGFIIVADEEIKQDYLSLCCNEINALKESYDHRSIWYRMAFWRAKPELNAIEDIKQSLLRNGFTQEQIKDTRELIGNKITLDSPFNYKTNQTESIQQEPEKEQIDIVDFSKPEKEQIDIFDFPETEKEASELDFEDSKKLTLQVLPKNNVQVIDPILGNVSEMYGVCLNNEKQTLQSSYELEEYAKQKLNNTTGKTISVKNEFTNEEELIPPCEKEITVKDVAFIEEYQKPNENDSVFIERSDIEEYDPVFADRSDFEEYDPNNEPDEEIDEKNL